MSIDDIFSSLSSHMLQGIMLHEQLMNIYLYMGLYGYAKCHEYHYLSETKNYISLCRYKVDHYGTVVSLNHINGASVIPESWSEVEKDNLDRSTRKKVMIAAFVKWISWEKETRELYNSIYKDLLEIREMNTSEFIMHYICDVEEEIVFSTNELLHKNSIDFDMVSIMEEQNKYEKEFTKMIKGLW